MYVNIDFRFEILPLSSIWFNYVQVDGEIHTSIRSLISIRRKPEDNFVTVTIFGALKNTASWVDSVNQTVSTMQAI
jgi:hypothetical protein